MTVASPGRNTLSHHDCPILDHASCTYCGHCVRIVGLCGRQLSSAVECHNAQRRRRAGVCNAGLGSRDASTRRLSFEFAVC